MAATTSGWQCPVEVTAMPAEKSKNSLLSTSLTTMPRPLLATSGYDRVYDGEMYFSSPSSTRLAFGPGRAVLILGPTVAVIILVVIGISSVSNRAVTLSHPLLLRKRHNIRATGFW